MFEIAWYIITVPLFMYGVYYRVREEVQYSELKWKYRETL